jgi:DNA repair protein RadD
VTHFALDGDSRDRVVAALNRLSSSELRKAVQDMTDGGRRGKSVERIVAETENTRVLMRTRIEDGDLARFLVDVSGPDLLANRRLRHLLALHATEDQLDTLHNISGVTRSRGTTREAYARCIADRKWTPSKRWARHFVSTLGLPPVLAGLSGAGERPPVEEVEPHVPLDPLEDFQEDLRQQVLDLLTAAPGSNRAVLTLPTGAGKTRTTVEALIDWWLAQETERFVLWVAQSDELCEQAVQAFREVWVDRGQRGVPLRIYRFWASHRAAPDDDSPGIVVSTIDKLRSVLVDADDGDHRAAALRLVPLLGVVVVDEAHRAEAQSYRRVLEAVGIDFTGDGAGPIPVLGLTATPLRSQHEETVRLARRFHNRLLRPRILPEDPTEAIELLRIRGVLSRPTHRILPATGRLLRLTEKQETYLEEWKELPPDVLAQLGEAHDRNQQLLAAILALDVDWPVLFFGCSVQHAEAMAVLLRRRGRESVAITAETREATRRSYVEAFRAGSIRVLCNYGVLTAGFDAPRVRAVVVGRPTTSRVLYEQMIGRGMRGSHFGGTEECLVVDVDDNLAHMDGRRLTMASRQYVEYWVRSEE